MNEFEAIKSIEDLQKVSEWKWCGKISKGW